MVKTIAITLLLGVFLAPTLAQGVSILPAHTLPDPGTLPDSSWYIFKRMSESIGTFFTFGNVAKTERYLELSERRLAEAERLAIEGKHEFAEEAAGRYQNYLAKALAQAESAKGKGLDVDEVLEKVSEATLTHQEVLAGVYERVPLEAKPAIERAMNAGMRGHEEALHAIDGEHGEAIRQQLQELQQETERRIKELREMKTPALDTPPPPNTDPDDHRGGPIFDFDPDGPAPKQPAEELRPDLF